MKPNVGTVCKKCRVVIKDGERVFAVSEWRNGRPGWIHTRHVRGVGSEVFVCEDHEVVFLFERELEEHISSHS